MTLIQTLNPSDGGGDKAVDINGKALGTLGHGSARLSIAQRDGRSFLDQRYFTDPYRIFTPRTTPGEPVSIVLSTLSGGLVGGDRLSFEGHVKPGASAQFVGQSAEKIYKSAGPTTQVEFSLRAEKDAWLEQVPQETILFDRSRMERRFNINIASGGQALVGDMVVLGRLAMGEQFAQGLFSDTWRLAVDDKLVWCDRMGFEGAGIEAAKANTFGLAGAKAFATILYVGEAAEQAVEMARDPLWTERAQTLGLRLGATCLGTHTLVRLMGPRPQDVRALLGDIWKQLRAQIGGFRPVLPTLWSI